jgi:hypothetical protein
MTQQTSKYWTSTNLKQWFNNADKISHNYAESDQDIFVLSMLNGLHNGTYLELGAGWPEHVSNTALLERQFGWSGVSLDYVDDYPEMWRAAGRKSFVQGNGQTVDFGQLLRTMPAVIDYLSVDCDPGAITFEILQRVPFDQYKFKIITFEHENHCEGPAIKIASRKFLLDLGYVLVANNISAHGIACDYEDWYAHPDLIDAERIQSHLCVDDSVKFYKTYLYR